MKIGNRILVVEYDEMIRSLCATILKRAGYNVETVETAREAMARVIGYSNDDPEEQYDIVLTSNYFGNGCSGVELIEHLTQSVKHPPVFCMMTGGNVQVLREHLAHRSLGGVPIIQRPFADVDVLTEFVERHMPATI